MKTKEKKLQRNNSWSCISSMRGSLYHPACWTFGSPYCQLTSCGIFSSVTLTITLTSTTVIHGRRVSHNSVIVRLCIQPFIFLISVGLRPVRMSNGYLRMTDEMVAYIWLNSNYFCNHVV